MTDIDTIREALEEWASHLPREEVLRASAALAALERVSAMQAEMRQLLARLVDQDDCQYDMNNACQAHGLDQRPCPHELAKNLLKESR